MVADVVLQERFDLGMREASRAKVCQGVLNQLAAEPVTTKAGGNRQVGDVADSRGPVLPGGNVADDLPIVLGDEDAPRLASRVVVEMPGLAPPPVVAIDRPELLLDPLITRDAVERGDGNRLARRQVVGSVGSDEHASRGSGTRGRESGVGSRESGKRLQIAN